MTEMMRDILIPALDLDNADAALRLVESLRPTVSTFKIGHSLFMAEGPRIVERITAGGSKVFLDMKLHDIPNSVELGARRAAAIGVSLLTVHASGGAEMVSAAVRGAGASCGILAVTLLTSISEEKAARIFGGAVPLERRISEWALMAVAAGAVGVVCSPNEARLMKSVLPNGALIVTPGIRSASDPSGDQSRTASAAQAVANGASRIVVGRPIIAAADPRAAVENMLSEIKEVL